MEEVKKLVTQTLEKKGILSRARAEIRAHVILAIEEQGGGGINSHTANEERDLLIQNPDGSLLLHLVHEFLEWSKMEFTLKVFEPELALPGKFHSRETLLAEMGLNVGSDDEPLLLRLLKGFQRLSNGQASSPMGPGKGPAWQGKTSPIAEKSSPEPPVIAPKAASPAPIRLPEENPQSYTREVNLLSPPSHPTPAPGAWVPPVASKPAYQAPPPAPPAPAAAQDVDESYEFDDVEEEEVIEDLVVEPEIEDASNLDDITPEVPPSLVAAKVLQDDVASETGSMGPTPGRLRPGKLRAAQGTISGDIMSADNSQDIGSAMAGLAPLPSSNPTFGRGDSNHTSLSLERSSLEMNNPLRGSLGKLEPLSASGGPLSSKLAPLGSLGPLKPPTGLAPLTKEDPLLRASGGRDLIGRKSADELKDELRRTGLISDSFSDRTPSHSMDLGDISVHTRTSNPGTPVAPPTAPTGGGGGLGAGGPGRLGPLPSLAVRQSESNVYDGEMSISASMDIHDYAEYDHPEMHAPPFINKNISMDLRETGLSAEDKSGEIDPNLSVDWEEEA